jgi:hypothetical protein
MARSSSHALFVCSLTNNCCERLAHFSARVEGIRPADSRTSPLSHPLKGDFTTSSGEPCIYYVPGGQFYDKTKARALLHDR